MTTAISDASLPIAPLPAPRCECLKKVALFIAKLAARILFVVGSLCATAYIFPAKVASFLFPVVGLAAVVGSMFLFSSSQDLEEAPLVVSSQPPKTRTLKTVDQPSGIINTGSDCFINSIVQMIPTHPLLNTWVHTPIPTTLDKFTDFLQAHECEDQCIGMFQAFSQNYPNPSVSISDQFIDFITKQTDTKDLNKCEKLLTGFGFDAGFIQDFKADSSKDSFLTRLSITKIWMRLFCKELAKINPSLVPVFKNYVVGRDKPFSEQMVKEFARSSDVLGVDLSSIKVGNLLTKAQTYSGAIRKITAYVNALKNFKEEYLTMCILKKPFIDFFAAYDAEKFDILEKDSRDLRAAIQRVALMKMIVNLEHDAVPEVIQDILKSTTSEEIEVIIDKILETKIVETPTEAYKNLMRIPNLMHQQQDVVNMIEPLLGCLPHQDKMVLEDGTYSHHVSLNIKEFNKKDFTFIPKQTALIQIKRFDNNLVKISKPIKDFNELMIQGKKYLLKGYIIHHGSTPASGHYTACAIYPKTEQKYHCNDEDVSSQTQEDWDKRASQAYFLCYVQA